MYVEASKKRNTDILPLPQILVAEKDRIQLFDSTSLKEEHLLADIQLADKDISMSGPVYIHASIATPRLAANHYPGNGLDHLHIVECPNVHIIFPSSCSSQYSPWHIIQHLWTTFKYNIQQNFDKIYMKFLIYSIRK